MKLVQDLRLHQLQVQEMFGQKAPVFLLTMEGRGQLFNSEDPGLEEALRQIHGISNPITTEDWRPRDRRSLLQTTDTCTVTSSNFMTGT